MGNIVVRHGKNGELGDRTLTTLNTTGTLVDGGQIGIHITRVTTTTGHLFTSGGNLTKSVSIRTHIRQNDEDVVATFVGEVLSSGEGNTRSNDTLNSGIIGEVQEKDRPLKRAVLLEILLEEMSSFHVHTHSGENNGELVITLLLKMRLVVRPLDKTCLTTNLRSDIVMGKTGSREKRNLLATSDGIHNINSRNASLNHFLRVGTLGRVNRSTTDIQELLSKDVGAAINRLARAVENATKHITRHRGFHDLASELKSGLPVVNTRGTLEDLDDGLVTINLKNLTTPSSTITKPDVHNLVILGFLDTVNNDKRSVDTGNSAVLNKRLAGVFTLLSVNLGLAGKVRRKGVNTRHP
mmetsp:Transcript_21553/g.38515  ORF Transcript_21553/g.38515 Transcript_21553/m.38515 type:complete len:353 (+) Transcript_21553:505-1563(+)